MDAGERVDLAPVVEYKIEHAAASRYKRADVARAAPNAGDANGVRGSEAKATCKLNTV
jgi:hypothetical protein